MLAQQPQPIHNLALSHGRWAVARILIVDDEPAVQATIRLLLERAGHSVVGAGNAEKGLALFEAEDFDLLLLDIFMAGMGGLEMMRRVHQQQPRIPIIVISGRPTGSEAGQDFLATRLGAVRSLQKPFRAAALLAAVADCLEASNRLSSPIATSNIVPSL
jgi:CheY-like chemotaxis protein